MSRISRLDRLAQIEAEMKEIDVRRTSLREEWKRLRAKGLDQTMKKLFPRGEITLQRTPMFQAIGDKAVVDALGYIHQNLPYERDEMTEQEDSDDYDY